MKKSETPSTPATGVVADLATPLAATERGAEPITNALGSSAAADRAALDFFGASTRDLLPEEADAWASLVSVVEVNRAIAAKRDVVVVDVRAADDYVKGHVPGAVSLPREQWHTAAGLSREKINVVYCYSGTCPLGGEACAKLAGEGYPVVEMDGGFEVWKTSELEIEQ